MHIVDCGFAIGFPELAHRNEKPMAEEKMRRYCYDKLGQTPLSTKTPAPISPCPRPCQSVLVPAPPNSSRPRLKQWLASQMRERECRQVRPSLQFQRIRHSSSAHYRLLSTRSFSDHIRYDGVRNGFRGFSNGRQRAGSRFA
jgi:hypothetical protein